MVEILFVHGALVRDGAWWWRAAAEIIAQSSGVTSRSVLLPSCGETGAAPGRSGLAEDASALAAALDESVEAIVVGHSYGGTVMAEGADHPAARHLLYISSYLPEVGQAQADIMSGEQDPVRVALNDDATVRVDGYDASSFGRRFLQDVTDGSIVDQAWDRVTAQGVGAFGTPTTGAAWQGRDSTYLLCTEDGSTSVALQREHAGRATTTVELPTGHHPFLSRPDLVASEVARILRTF
jgi:pimeloyl-ACP methyl ester carboxylesterase